MNVYAPRLEDDDVILDIGLPLFFLGCNGEVRATIGEEGFDVLHYVIENFTDEDE